MGKVYAYGDASNTATRVFLSEFSKQFNTFFGVRHKIETLKYFDYQCPYSGESIDGSNYIEDHIIPFNKGDCGLHLYGNVLLVTAEANKAKHSKPLAEI
ncbi:MAG: HNH endonuclease [Spirochaetaceae bacterium]|nr:HNH endonuclease [Spirochaetaceae bacterium]